MPEYAVYRNGVFEKIEIQKRRPPDIPQRNIKWYNVVREPRPAFDAATQTVDQTTTLGADTVTYGWTVRNKTVEETDGETTQLTSIIPRATFAVLFFHENRIRALENKAPITAEQFRQAIKDRL